MLNIPCVLFAGGKSSRMGEDKALLPFANYTTLTEFQYSRLSKIFSHVYISCKDKNKFDFQAACIEDIQTDGVYAPTVGFISAFEQLKCKSFFAISVDAPFIDEVIIQRLFQNDKPSNDATIAKTQRGVQPLCGIYHISLLPRFKQMQKNDNHKLGRLLKDSKSSFIYFENDEKFLNLNTPQEYTQALHVITSNY